MTPAPDTRTRILDAAQNLFSDKGFRETSLRAITAAAGANLAAVNYHFGSKEALVQAVFHRLLEPANRERLARLDAAEAAARPGEPDLHAVLEAFLAPPVAMASRPEGPTLGRLFSRLFLERGETLRKVFEAEFGEVARRFPPALATAAPHLSPDELQRRFHFMIGAMHQALGGGKLPGEACGPARGDDLLAQLLAFCEAGFAAPSARPQPAGEQR